MKDLLLRLVREEEGQDMIEYALVAAIITVGAIVTVLALGTKVTNLWTQIDTTVGTAPGAGT